MAPKVEKRADPDDGKRYTLNEFVEYYGKKAGNKKWEAAGKATGNTAGGGVGSKSAVGAADNTASAVRPKAKAKASAKRGHQAFKGTIDVDQDGKINRKEFRSWVQRQGLGYKAEEVDSMFALWDKDDTGFIDTAEFEYLLRASQTSHKSVSVSVIVPSTSAVDVKGTVQELEGRRDRVLGFFADRFGGATARAAHRGAYRSEKDGSLVYEEGVSVTTFATPEQWAEHAEPVRLEVRKYCAEWGQECMALIVGGAMEYVMPKEHDAESLCRSFIARMELRQRLHIPGSS